MKKLIASREELEEICKRIGAQITEDCKKEEKVPVILGVMKGCLNFMMDLLKYVECPIYTDFIQIASMAGVKSTGKVSLLRDLAVDVKDRLVIIVEDVVDTGISMDYLVTHMQEKFKAKEVRVCTLFNKTASRKIDVPIFYEGKRLEHDDFLLGYGLDYYEFERNVPYVYTPTKEEIDHFDELAKK